MLKILSLKHWKRQEGITGLETAIILIAFVVVASVFAYTVLSAGLFSTQKSQQSINAGIQQAQSALELKGAVVVGGLCQLTNCDSASPWAAGTNITVGADTTDKIEGTGSVSFTAGANITAAQDIGTITLPAARDMTDSKNVYFWIKSSAAILGNGTESLTLTMLDSSGNTTTTTSTLGALTAGTWKKIDWDISGVAADHKNAVTGLTLSVAGSSPTISSGDVIHLDNIETEPVLSTSNPLVTYGNSAVFTVATSLGTDGVDFTTTTDTNQNGLLSDETTKNHKVIISYNDQYQTLTDLAWTKTAIGYNDGTNILKANEKFQITVDLTAVNDGAANTAQKLGPNHAFTIEIKPPNGASMVISETMPAKITAINTFN